jgi:hypothetical protein
MKLVSFVFALVAATSPVWAVDTTVAALQNVKAAHDAISHQQNARALGLAKKALAVLEANPPKPEGLTQADWDKRRSLAIGTAHWIAGVAEANSNQFVVANKDLKAALPILKDDKDLNASTLFYLGVANYQIGRMMNDKSQILQAAKYSEQCASVPGPLQERAYENAKAMRKEAATMR